MGGVGSKEEVDRQSTEGPAKPAASEASAGAVEGEEEMVARLMNEDGPVVKAVVLPAKGKAKEQVIDMTPRKRLVDAMLGGCGVTFLGQYDEIEVIVVASRNTKHPLSRHTLPFPLHEVVVRGDVVLMRSDQSAVPQDFTLAEFEALASRAVPESERLQYEQEKAHRAADAEKAAAEFAAAAMQGEAEESSDEDGDEEFTAEDAAAAEEDEEEDEDGEEEEEAEGEVDQRVLVLNQVVQLFVLQHGREPSMEEIKDTLRGMQGGAEEEDEEVEEEKEDEVEQGTSKATLSAIASPFGVSELPPTPSSEIAPAGKRAAKRKVITNATHDKLPRTKIAKLPEVAAAP